MRKQYKRNRQLWDAADESLPIFGTIAAQFNDAGMNRLFTATLETIARKTGVPFSAQRPLVAGANPRTTADPRSSATSSPGPSERGRINPPSSANMKIRLELSLSRDEKS